ncbi:serine/threonine dehydratase [Rhodococcus sp. IEGM 1379]|uniref:serine/threonine dehydratase n=1 Tax=Rhodococcus sp. IEGM 1379 TaxID=3047086 RepID=UPI0024B71DD4|nr:serine/threonine dehydratase [Rhodococcus sp. IEGM 1379]MDI9913957.1 serine/threonine dehydratase [Rhodococcus sp. IEGM 1379]
MALSVDNTALPVSIERTDVEAARVRIAGLARRTPVFRASVSTPSGDISVLFKLEYLQHGGSFKVRGSLNAVESAIEAGVMPDAGVVIASGGNAAIGAAWAARRRSLHCTVVVPETAPEAKVKALGELGATVEKVGDRYAAAAAAATVIARSSGALELHAYDLPDIVSGAGSIALEVEEEVSGPITYCISVGGGGLVSGIAAAARECDQVVAVEPTGAATLRSALDAGRPVDIEVNSIAGDSLGATRIGAIAWATLAKYPANSVVVEDDSIILARLFLWREFRILVELGTAATLVPVLDGRITAPLGGELCVVLCGANTDPGHL